MQDKLDRLRELVQASLKSDPPLFRSVNDLSVRADVDTASLWRFLKAEPGTSGKVSFIFAAKLLYAIGGRVLFPDEREEDVVRYVTSPAVRTAAQIVNGYEVAAKEFQTTIVRLFEALGRMQKEPEAREDTKKTAPEEVPKE